MENSKPHISSYKSHATVLISLLFLTAISVGVTWIRLGSFSVAIALLVASIKGTIVLTWFMHLKFDKPLYRIMVIGVMLLFILIIGITFIDYVLR